MKDECQPSMSEAPKSFNWQVVATSVCGTSHQKRSQPCQDAHHWYGTPDGVLIAAVADGAGSATLGDVGAQIAVRTAVNWLRDRLDLLLEDPENEGDGGDLPSPTPDLPSPESSSQTPGEGPYVPLTEALEAARKAVEAEAIERQMSVRELASTLILVVATPKWVAGVQVGDGAAVLGDRQSQMIPLTRPNTGEYLNETTFLVSPKALETAQFQFWSGRPAQLAIFSDGLQLLALQMPDAVPHAPFFSPLFRFVAQEDLDETEATAQLENFLTSPRVTQRTDDDLTLFLATLKSEIDI